MNKKMVTGMKKTNTTTLAYDIRLPKEVQYLSLQTLGFILPVENVLIERFWSEEKLKELKETITTKQVWKHLEGILDRPAEIPSRVWRGILEVVGRTILAQAERMELFYFLKGITTNEKEWCWQLCKDNGKPFVKANYIYLLKDAVEVYRKKNDRFPDSYFDIARKPELKNGLLTYAPDDGQAIRYDLEGTLFKVRLKLFDGENWVWKETSFELPDVVKEKLEQGTMVSPDLRQKNGKVFLDLKVKLPDQEKTGKNKMFVDWGVTRKLLTVIIVTPDGTQIGSPIFLKYDGILRKLHRIRQAIDHLKKTRGKIARRKDTKRWDRYTYLIGQHWDKYKQLQKELSHLASNTLIDIAEAYDCDSIFVEDLATLKAKKYSRWLNRIINNTVRGQIYSKVEYKGKLKGIKLEKPVKAWHTSQYCPLSGELGKRYTAPNGEPKEGGGWFVSNACSLDADYIACKNLVRRVLFDFKLSRPKSLGYIPRDTLGKQFSRGTEGLRNLRRTLSGWNGGVKVVPDSVFYPLRV
jgi:putative transposase